MNKAQRKIYKAQNKLNESISRLEHAVKIGRVDLVEYHTVRAQSAKRKITKLAEVA